MGPPCDPIDGWGVDKGQLHCSFHRGIMQKFKADYDNQKALADKRWTEYYGGLSAGPFNSGCYGNTLPCGKQCGAPCPANFPNRTDGPVPPPQPTQPPAPTPPGPRPPRPPAPSPSGDCDAALKKACGSAKASSRQACNQCIRDPENKATLKAAGCQGSDAKAFCVS